jgi:hypothetical protein
MVRRNHSGGDAATEVVAELDLFLSAAIRMIPQMPDDRLDTEVPNQLRSYRVL